MREFDKWIGTWETNYKNNVNDVISETLTVKWAHFDRWLQFDISGSSSDQKLKFSSTMYLTIDDDFNVIGWYINESGYVGMANVKGVIEEGKIILESKSKNWKDKSTWNLDNSRLHNKGKSTSVQSGESFSNEIIYTRKDN
jgi:hypothetical protein